MLRAMETAGKFVEDEELRAAMKENGIGRPSSRAGIIETLFKRHYIRRERKRLVATPTGIELIDLIREELLKSCELTGIWEKKLRDIEAIHRRAEGTGEYHRPGGDERLHQPTYYRHACRGREEETQQKAINRTRHTLY